MEERWEKLAVKVEGGRGGGWGERAEEGNADGTVPQLNSHSAKEGGEREGRGREGEREGGEREGRGREKGREKGREGRGREKWRRAKRGRRGRSGRGDGGIEERESIRVNTKKERYIQSTDLSSTHLAHLHLLLWHCLCRLLLWCRWLPWATGWLLECFKEGLATPSSTKP